MCAMSTDVYPKKDDNDEETISDEDYDTWNIDDIDRQQIDHSTLHYMLDVSLDSNYNTKKNTFDIKFIDGELKLKRLTLAAVNVPIYVMISSECVTDKVRRSARGGIADCDKDKDDDDDDDDDDNDDDGLSPFDIVRIKCARLEKILRNLFRPFKCSLKNTGLSMHALNSSLYELLIRHKPHYRHGILFRLDILASLADDGGDGDPSASKKPFDGGKTSRSKLDADNEDRIKYRPSTLRERSRVLKFLLENAMTHADLYAISSLNEDPRQVFRYNLLTNMIEDYNDGGLPIVEYEFHRMDNALPVHAITESIISRSPHFWAYWTHNGYIFKNCQADDVNSQRRRALCQKNELCQPLLHLPTCVVRIDGGRAGGHGKYLSPIDTICVLSLVPKIVETTAATVTTSRHPRRKHNSYFVYVYSRKPPGAECDDGDDDDDDDTSEFYKRTLCNLVEKLYGKNSRRCGNVSDVCIEFLRFDSESIMLTKFVAEMSKICLIPSDVTLHTLVGYDMYRTVWLPIMGRLMDLKLFDVMGEFISMNVFSGQPSFDSNSMTFDLNVSLPMLLPTHFDRTVDMVRFDSERLLRDVRYPKEAAEEYRKIFRKRHSEKSIESTAVENGWIDLIKTVFEVTVLEYIWSDFDVRKFMLFVSELLNTSIGDVFGYSVDGNYDGALLSSSSASSYKTCRAFRNRIVRHLQNFVHYECLRYGRYESKSFLSNIIDNYRGNVFSSVPCSLSASSKNRNVDAAAAAAAAAATTTTRRYRFDELTKTYNKCAKQKGEIMDVFLAEQRLCTPPVWNRKNSPIRGLRTLHFGRQGLWTDGDGKYTYIEMNFTSAYGSIGSVYNVSFENTAVLPVQWLLTSLGLREIPDGLDNNGADDVRSNDPFAGVARRYGRCENSDQHCHYLFDMMFVSNAKRDRYMVNSKYFRLFYYDSDNLSEDSKNDTKSEFINLLRRARTLISKDDEDDDDDDDDDDVQISGFEITRLKQILSVGNPSKNRIIVIYDGADTCSTLNLLFSKLIAERRSLATRYQYDDTVVDIDDDNDDNSVEGNDDEQRTSYNGTRRNIIDEKVIEKMIMQGKRNVLKLTTNMLYGLTNKENSCVYSPSVALTITILCKMLITVLVAIIENLCRPDVAAALYVNIDTVICRIPRTTEPRVRSLLQTTFDKFIYGRDRPLNDDDDDDRKQNAKIELRTVAVYDAIMIVNTSSHVTFSNIKNRRQQQQEFTRDKRSPVNSNDLYRIDIKCGCIVTSQYDCNDFDADNDTDNRRDGFDSSHANPEYIPHAILRVFTFICDWVYFSERDYDNKAIKNIEPILRELLKKIYAYLFSLPEQEQFVVVAQRCNTYDGLTDDENVPSKNDRSFVDIGCDRIVKDAAHDLFVNDDTAAASSSEFVYMWPILILQTDSPTNRDGAARNNTAHAAANNPQLAGEFGKFDFEKIGSRNNKLTNNISTTVTEENVTVNYYFFLKMYRKFIYQIFCQSNIVHKYMTTKGNNSERRSFSRIFDTLLLHTFIDACFIHKQNKE